MAFANEERGSNIISGADILARLFGGGASTPLNLDYRCFIKLNDPTALKRTLHKIEIEATNGDIYSLTQIAEAFADFNQLMTLTQEPIGDVFDTVAWDEKIGFCFIHDKKKTFNFFQSLTNYIYETLHAELGDAFALVADVTDYDDDSFGNHIFYYLGEGLKTLEIQGPKGLKMHAEKEISELLSILKKHGISTAEKQWAEKYYVKLGNLMNYRLNALFNHSFDE